MPYPTGAYPQTHPDRLAVIATLLGMTPAPPERCRVLEIGCGDGGNLIPMAFALPESRFTGFDLSSTAVASGRDLASKAGLANVALDVADLAQYMPEAGAYDYVIAHGVYAWIAPPLQEKLMALVRAALAPQGVAIVSYNAYPGARLREIVRGILRYHGRAVPDPKERLAKSKALLGTLARAWPSPTDVRHWVGKQAELTLARERDNLFHDELSDDYTPVHFHEFMAQASRHGLQYLGETDFFEMNDMLLSPEHREILKSLAPADIVEKEQYMDFLKNRAFRQTLLCRREVDVRRAVTATLLDRFLVESRAEETPSAGGTKETQYRTARGATMATSDPFTQRMMKRLDEAAPRPLSFQELQGDGIRDADLRLLLMGMYGSAVINLRLWKPPCAATVGPRPEASRLARIQLQRRPIVTSLSHHDLNLVDHNILSLMRRLDGTRDRATLIRDLAEAGVKATEAGIDTTLRQLAKLSVLTS